MKNKKVCRLARKNPEFEDQCYKFMGLRKEAQIGLKVEEYKRGSNERKKSLAERSSTSKRISKKIKARQKAKRAAIRQEIAEEFVAKKEYEKEVRSRFENDFCLA